MLRNITESLAESVKRVPGKAKETALNTLGGLYDMVKGSDSIRGEIRKQVGTAINTPIEAGGSVLTAGSQLVRRHPIEATKTTASAFIEASKNVTKMGLSPLSGTVTLARSGLRTCKKILSSPSNFAFSAYHSAQVVNEKLFSLPDKFKKWNKVKTEAPTPTTEAPEPIGNIEEPSGKKVPNLMQIPGGKTDSMPEPKAEAEEQKAEEQKTDTQMAA